MLTNSTIEGLRTLRLTRWPTASPNNASQPDYAELSFEERLGLLVDRELARPGQPPAPALLKSAKLRLPAAIEELDFSRPPWSRPPHDPPARRVALGR